MVEASGLKLRAYPRPDVKVIKVFKVLKVGAGEGKLSIVNLPSLIVNLKLFVLSPCHVKGEYYFYPSGIKSN